MQCPYCYSENHSDAVVCRICHRDFSLVIALKKKVDDLESLSTNTLHKEYEKKILVLEEKIRLLELNNINHNPVLEFIQKFTSFLLLPMLLIGGIHALITIVLDTNILYLRIVAILLPMLSGYLLFRKGTHSFSFWVFMAVLFSLISVTVMSWITSLSDNTPIAPQNLAEWKDFIYFSLSIWFGFLAGMMLGQGAKKRDEGFNSILQLNWIEKTIVKLIGVDKHNLANFEKIAMKILATLTTLLSLYSGLKGILKF
jgi:hypothetical protein